MKPFARLAGPGSRVGRRTTLLRGRPAVRSEQARLPSARRPARARGASSPQCRTAEASALATTPACGETCLREASSPSCAQAGWGADCRCTRGDGEDRSSISPACPTSSQANCPGCASTGRGSTQSAAAWAAKKRCCCPLAPRGRPVWRAAAAVVEPRGRDRLRPDPPVGALLQRAAETASPRPLRCSHRFLAPLGRNARRNATARGNPLARAPSNGVARAHAAASNHNPRNRRTPGRSRNRAIRTPRDQKGM